MDLDLHAMGLRIRCQREFLGYTREKFAELIEVSQTFCAEMELGRKGISLHTLFKIAHALHLSADYILFGTRSFDEGSAIDQMLSRCPDDKRAHLEQIMLHFLQALEP